MDAGRANIDLAVEELAAGLPAPLADLAGIAYDYRWSWTPGADAVFAALDPDRWGRIHQNPVRMLRECSRTRLNSAAADEGLLDCIGTLLARYEDDGARASADVPGISRDSPVAFVCAEFGVHESLPVYSGGLGALAGDMLKQASDDAFPLVAMGLLYREGYFRQRIDAGGLQHESWDDLDPEMVPAARVTDDAGAPITITVPVSGEAVLAHIWRVDVGRVPLFLLDTDVPGNSPIARWITARLYVGDPQIRLAQYAMLGIGSMRALSALGISPSVVHLNEGHGALAAFELAREQIGDGVPVDQAIEHARRQVVFTTHTPVPAGNDTYPAARAIGALGEYAREIGLDDEDLLRLGRTDPLDLDEEFGITQLALRTSRAANGVSRRHGRVSRRMWAPVWPGRAVDGVPITHVTNGVHIPSWVGPEMNALFDRILTADWRMRSAVPETWQPLAEVPAAELWAARCAQRARLVSLVRMRSVHERLGRGEETSYVEAAARVFDPAILTIGFARRLATYKRLDLLVHDVDRAMALLNGNRPVQLVLAGKAHPHDDEGKRLLQDLFGSPVADDHGTRVVFLDDYDLGLARVLVQGCDLWLNLPRPPLEASGTSGMKSSINGGLQLSVLDGWWAEGYDPSRGWAIDGTTDDDHAAQDARDADALFSILEGEVLPAFYDRDADDLPTGWLSRMRASVMGLAPEFSAARMLDDYESRVYSGA